MGLIPAVVAAGAGGLVGSVRSPAAPHGQHAQRAALQAALLVRQRARRVRALALQEVAAQCDEPHSSQGAQRGAGGSRSDAPGRGGQGKMLPCWPASLLSGCHHDVPTGAGVATDGDGAELKVRPCFRL